MPNKVIAACLVAVLGVGISVIVTRHRGLPKHGIVVGLGDSVAAGQGFGKADGYPDNPGAYPARVAAHLGWRVENFAIAGACAAAAAEPGVAPNTPEVCAHSVLRDELPAARRAVGAKADVVVMTVGANDIDFSGCIVHELSPFPFGFDPCGSAALTDSLRALRANLRRLLRAVHDAFPKARVVTTGYYDPLPPASALCPLAEAYAGVTHPNDLLDPVGLRRDALMFQSSLHAKAEAVIENLDATIRKAAIDSDTGVDVAYVDFSGHDLCRDANDSWVFGPSLDVTLSGPLLNGGTRRWSMLLPSRCPDISLDPEPFHVRLPWAGGKLILDARLAINCMPHPTEAGQEAIARLVLRALGVRR